MWLSRCPKPRVDFHVPNPVRSKPPERPAYLRTAMESRIFAPLTWDSYRTRLHMLRGMRHLSGERSRAQTGQRTVSNHGEGKNNQSRTVQTSPLGGLPWLGELYSLYGRGTIQMSLGCSSRVQEHDSKSPKRDTESPIRDTEKRPSGVGQG